MSEPTFTPWREQFGLDSRRSPEFFTGKEELSATIPQAHLLQRGFDDLSLDGILCTENTPLVYFRQVDQIDNDWVANFRRTFWYHGGAPVLCSFRMMKSISIPALRYRRLMTPTAVW